jgi:hypothetical protein
MSPVLALSGPPRWPSLSEAEMLSAQTACPLFAMTPRRALARSGTAPRQSWSVKVCHTGWPMSPVAALTTLLMLVVLRPAAAAPLIPAVKSAQCPFGYMQSGGYCMPMSRPAPVAVPKVGKCPRGYGRSDNSCFDSGCVDADRNGCGQRTKRDRVRLVGADEVIETDAASSSRCSLARRPRGRWRRVRSRYPAAYRLSRSVA